MANFHTNMLAIAANERDMLAVLRQIAMNLACAKETDYDDLLEDARDPGHAFSRLRNGLESWYWLAFTPNGIGSEEWEAAHPDAAHQELSKHPEYGALANAVSSALGSDSGATISVKVQPSGRPLSETGDASLQRFGETYALSLSYSTAWESNVEDVSALFELLPPGGYGVAFLDGDEYDGYSTINSVAGTLRGSCPLWDCEDVVDIPSDDEDMVGFARSAAENDLAQERDLGRVASTVAVCLWPDYGFSSDIDSELLREELAYERACSDYQEFGMMRFGVSTSFAQPGPAWIVPQEKDFKKIDSAIVSLLARFPFECEVTGQAYEGRNANIDLLAPGARILLRSDWNSPYFSPVGIGIFDAKGRSLGNLGGYFNPSDDDRTAVACLLPHIRATAEDVSPLAAALDGRRKMGQFTVHLEIEPIDLAKVLDEVHELLSRAVSERTLESIMEEGR